VPNRKRSKEQDALTRREHEEQRAAKTRRTRRIAVVAVLAVVIVGGIVLVAQQRKPETTTTAASGSASPQSAGDVKGAGCSTVKTIPAFDPASKDRAHGDLAPLGDYPSIPPTSGPHASTTVAAGVYTQPVDLAQQIHSLEHGGATIWISPSVADSPEATAIAAFIRETPENTDHTILAPYDYPDQGDNGTLPSGKTMVLVSWHRMMTCDRPSLPAVETFLGAYRFPPLGDGDYKGDAPEQGVPI
jgi:hypothetical protein